MPTHDPATDASTTATTDGQLTDSDLPEVIAQEAGAQTITDQQVIEVLWLR